MKKGLERGSINREDTPPHDHDEHGHNHDNGLFPSLSNAVEYFGVPDSIPGGTGTTQTLAVGGSVTGTISPETDTDWFRITLTAGKTYTFNLDGTGTSKLNDPFLYLYNGAGSLIGSDDDNGPGLNSRLVFTPSTSGTYYLSAAAYVDSSYDNVGQYTISASAAGTQPVYSLPQIANYLTDGYWGGHGFHFSTSVISYNLTGLTAAAQPLARLALKAWQDVANITFRETTGSANITFDDTQNGAFASSNGTTARVNVGPDWMSAYGATTDSYTLQTFIHEIGHTLGLGHAGPYNGSARYGVDNLYANDTWQYTVMSYFSQSNYGGASYRFVMTPQVADIVAVQSLYGAATATRTGDTVYGFNSNAGPLLSFNSYTRAPALTIYDSGGSDTLDCSGYGTNQVIDLTPGSFSSIGGLTGNIAIATNALIEKAIGGAGNDTLTGNSAINTLQGRAGNDTYYVNHALDSVVEAAGGGNDTVITSVTYQLAAGSSVEVLRINGPATTGAINLTGNEFNNTLQGNAGANVLDGRGGADMLYGYGGNDTYWVDSTLDQVIEAVGQGSDTVIVAAGSYVLQAGSEIELLRTLGSASTAVQNLTGNAFGQTILGTAAANVLNGGGGIDTLYGYGGSDFFRFDTALGVSNVDVIGDFNVLQDTIQLARSIFTGLAAGTLASSAFVIGAQATDANDRIIYNSTTGALTYDTNGNGAGGATQFAKLAPGLALTYNDFLIV